MIQGAYSANPGPCTGAAGRSLVLAALPFFWRALDLGGLKGPPEMQQPFFHHMEPHRAQVDTTEEDQTHDLFEPWDPATLEE